MNVLQILPELNAGGVERTTLEVTDALTQAGHTAHVASGGGRMEAELKRLGGISHILDIGCKNPLRIRRNTKALIELIHTHKIDIVHARSRAPAWPAHMAARRTGTPFITTYHGIYNAKSGIKRRYNAVMTKGDIIIANSNYTKAHIIAEHGTDPAKIEVVPRGVDLNVFDPANISPEAIIRQKAQWNIAPEVKLILLPGRLTRWKGQILAVSALAKIPSDAVLVLMGDAQGRENYVKDIDITADQLGIKDRLRIVGHSENVPVALMAADVVLSASTDPEAFGRVAVEAQAMGRPVIATAHGGTLETVIDGQTGWHVPPGDVDALAEVLAGALNGYAYDATAARDHITEHFSTRQLQNKVLKIYERLLISRLETT